MEKKDNPSSDDASQTHDNYSQKGEDSANKKSSDNPFLTTKTTDARRYLEESATSKASHTEGTPRPLYGWIVGLISTNIDRDYRLFEGKNTIGRTHGNSIVINDSTVSKEHCTIMCQKGEMLIKDNNSTNGVIVNNKRVNDSTLLKNGDLLFLGDVAFQVVFYKRLYSRGQI
ncbi:MAG: FHA domain-containing protein [Nitrospirae bacterium]|nr:FHA domain-containing protein [Nitrospirota bacterium]MBF0534088.1 FHA domain-containing protein [Nitrospirota bacterium]MBF0616247.1 FHA domain-containing protein [Nitrospirota bacterium]